MASHCNIKDNKTLAFALIKPMLIVQLWKDVPISAIRVFFKASCDFFNYNYSANFNVNRCI